MRTLGVLLPWLTGGHALTDILDGVKADGVEGNDAVELLQRLEEAHLLEDGQHHGLSDQEQRHFRRQIAFFSRFTTEGGAKHQALLARTLVAIVGDGPFAESVCRQLDATGFGDILRLSEGQGADEYAASFVSRARLRTAVLNREYIWRPVDGETTPQVFVVPLDTHDPKLLEAMDTCSKTYKVSWLLVENVEFREGRVGPLFVPDETADYLSLKARLRGNLPFFDEHEAFDGYLRREDRASAPCGGLHAHYELLSAIATSEIVKYVTGITVPHLAGRMLTIGFANWETEMHDVLKIPRVDVRVANEVPAPFAWKEIPYAEIPSGRDGILGRRA